MLAVTALMVIVPGANAASVTVGYDNVFRIIGGNDTHNDDPDDDSFSVFGNGDQRSFCYTANVTFSNALAAVLGALGPNEKYRINSATLYAGTAADNFAVACPAYKVVNPDYDPTDATWPYADGDPDVAWNTAGCDNSTTDYDGTAVAVGVVNGDTTEWRNLESLVQAWIDGTETNRGLFFFGNFGGGHAPRTWPSKGNIHWTLDAEIPPALQLANSSVSGISATDATASAELTSPLGTVSSAQVWLVWSDVADQGTSLSNWPNTNAPAAYVTTGTTANVTFGGGLTGSTTYHYRLFATNATDGAGAWSSADSFMTALDTSGFLKKMKITFSGYSETETLTNFPALVVFSNGVGSGFAYSQFASVDGYDLRFTDEDETTELNYETEEWNVGGVSYVWVQVPALTNSGHIWAYWDNPSLAAGPAVYTTNGAVWSQNYSGVWHMTETDAVDSTTNANNGTAGGSVGPSVQTAGAISDAISFPGSTATIGGQAYIDLDGSGSLKMGNTFTFSAWTKWTAGNDDKWGRIVSKKTAHNSNRGWGITHSNNDDDALDVAGSGAHTTLQNAVDSWNAANWEYVTAVYNGATASIYINGAFVGNVGVTSVVDDDEPLVIGNNAVHGEWNWSGDIDEVRCSDALRSANWIMACYSNQVRGSTFAGYGVVEDLTPATGPLALLNVGVSNATIAVNDATVYAGLTSPDKSLSSADIYVAWNATADQGTNALSAWGVNTNYSGSFATGTTATANFGGALSEETTYHYRLFATNASGNVAWSKADTVTTASGDPAVNTTNGATSVETDAATLQGTLTSTGAAPTTVYAYYGTADGANNKAAWTAGGQVGTSSGAMPQGFTTNVIGLADSTTYYYRFYATNIYGDDWSATARFTTKLDPSAFERKMKIVFSGYDKSETLTNFPALVVLSNNVANGFSYSDFESDDGYDLRFADASETTGLNYEPEEWNTGGVAYVWVQVPELTGGGHIWAYWGNASLTAGPAPYTTNGATWSEGYLGVWHLNETSGHHADSTSNNFDTTTETVTTQGSAAGRISGADYFDSSDDNVVAPSVGLSDKTWTISAWLNPDSLTAWDGIVITEGAGDRHGMMYDDQSKLGFMIEGQPYTWNGGPGISAGQWQMVSMAVSPTDVSVYVNDASATNSSYAVPVPDATTDTWFMSDGVRAGRYMGGTLDEVRISDVTRSANWIWACYSNQAAGSTFATYGVVMPTDTAPPVIYNDVATDIGVTTAVLNGYLTWTGMAETAVWVYWGTNDGENVKGDWDTFEALGVCTNDVPPARNYSMHRTNLAADTTYYYRYYATNDYGDGWAAPSESFTTRRPRNGLVKSFKTYSLTLGAGIHAVTNPLAGGEDVSQCVPFATTAHDGGGASSVGSYVADIYFLTSPNRVVVERARGEGAFHASVAVVEFAPTEVKVLSGAFSIAENPSTATLSEPVDLNHAAAVAYYQVSSSDSDIREVLLMTELTSPSQLRFSRMSADDSAAGHWYVFEAVDDGFTVQAGTVHVDLEQTQAGLALDPVSMDKTMIIASTKHPGTVPPWPPHGPDVRGGCMTAELADDRTVLVRRNHAVNRNKRDCYASIFAIEFARDERVQRGSFSSWTGTGSKTSAIAPVDTSLAMGWSPSMAGLMMNDNRYERAFCGCLQLVTIGSETEVVGTRKSANGTAYGRWEVVEWAAFERDVGLILIVR